MKHGESRGRSPTGRVEVFASLPTSDLHRVGQMRITDRIERAYKAGYAAGFKDGRQSKRLGQGLLPDFILYWAPLPDEVWSCKSVYNAIAEEGLVATTKQIQNALAYLTRKKLLVRVSYGKYQAKSERIKIPEYTALQCAT